MFGHKSPLHFRSKHKSVDTSNPFESDEELNKKKTPNPARRTSSEPTQVIQNLSSNPFDDDNDIKGNSSSNYSISSSDRNRYKKGFNDSGGLENQSDQELENYAVYKAEETTNSVNSCLKIAEDIREDATKTLVTLHYQGEQINRSHMVASEIDHDLSRGEKLLGTLGGMFSKTWKPKKNRTINGPENTRDDPAQKRGNHLEQRERLGLSSGAKERTHSKVSHSEPTNALQKVEVEKVKQDDALSDLSNIVGELKNMALDMGNEMDRQNKALDHFQDDVEELDYRVKNANQRGRRLLGK